MITKCDVVGKHKNGEYYSCRECKHCYSEELDNWALECELPNHSFYNYEIEEETDEWGNFVERICDDFIGDEND